MYTVRKDKRVYLLSRDDNYTEYETYEKFIEKVAKQAFYRRQHIRRNAFNFMCEMHEVVKDVGNNWNDTYRFCDDNLFSVYSKVDYILYDANFRVIHTEKIKKDVDNYVPIWYNKGIRYGRRKWYFKEHEWLGFRNGPVPYTGCSKWNFSNFYKMPKTTQERRASCEHKKYVRPKRNNKKLPNSWDDRPRSNIYSKCWKDCTKRRKQWMR